jgi:predicted small integral membrane protein
MSMDACANAFSRDLLGMLVSLNSLNWLRPGGLYYQCIFCLTTIPSHILIVHILNSAFFQLNRTGLAAFVLNYSSIDSLSMGVAEPHCATEPTVIHTLRPDQDMDENS